MGPMADPIRDFALDDDGDRAFANGDSALVAGAAAVKQGIRIKLQVFLGEVYADQTLGVDYLNEILIKSPDPLLVRDRLKTRIESVADVAQVVGANLTIDRPTRTGAIRFKYRDAYSTSPVEDTVTVPA